MFYITINNQSDTHINVVLLTTIEPKLHTRNKDACPFIFSCVKQSFHTRINVVQLKQIKTTTARKDTREVIHGSTMLLPP